MKWIKAILLLIIIIIIVAIICIPRMNRFQRDGEITLSGLSAPVKVLRDEKGMAYIYAENLSDALKAQGFVTAQDRLFQMELTKLFAEGRICELAGEGAKALDTRMRTLGFHRNAKKHAAILNPPARKYIQDYLDGVNEFIARGENIPLEFKLAGIKPQPWNIDDSMAIVYYMGWNSAANLHTEIIAQMLVEKLGIAKAQEIFPVNTNPDEGMRSAMNDRPLRDMQQLGLDLHQDKNLLAYMKLCSLRVGSNNWTVSPRLSASDKPIVCNDPHLDARMLPGPWHPIGIITPSIRVAGVIVPGMGGIVIGRNEHIAIGVTNSYGDAQDLYVETVDPRNPDNYLEGSRSIPFEILKETLKIKDKEAPEGFREEEITIKRTRRGPVISKVLPDLKTEKVLTVRWSPYETMQPYTGFEEILMAKSIDDIRKSLQKLTCLMLNFVFADDQGNIGWQTSGRIPLRSQRDSTVPFVVKDSSDNWKGFIPFDKMPQSYNPPRGWLGTCNHTTITKSYPYYMSSYFAPYYRYARLKEILDSVEKTTAEDHWKYQRDYKNTLAQKMAAVLAEWDFLDDKEKAAPAVFQSVLREFALQTFQDELGEELAKTMLEVWYFWENRLEIMVREGTSEWFDDVSTEEKESMTDILHRAALAVMKEHGSDPEGWKWGEFHQLEFVCPIMRKGPLKGLLGGGSHPMSGSQETLYRAIYSFNEPFAAQTTASLRMVVDLADKDKVLAVLPGGVSARLFDDHNTDQIDAFMSGEKLYWWFSDEMIKAHTKYSCMLNPSK
jgi:penicillin amidase